jgi:hypothetical protein
MIAGSGAVPARDVRKRHSRAARANKSTQFAEQTAVDPPLRHYDRGARSSLTDDPDIMPGDEKRGPVLTSHRK